MAVTLLNFSPTLPALVGMVLPHAPAEEALAAVTAGSSVVLPRGPVRTYRAQVAIARGR